MLNETLAEKKNHICIFPKSSQQRCNIFKNASIFLKNRGSNIYAFDSSYVLCSLNDTHKTLSYNYRTPSEGPATSYPIARNPDLGADMKYSFR